MDADEVEDNGIPVEALSENDILEKAKEKLREVGNLLGGGIALDSERTCTSGVVTVDSTVVALLVTSTGGEGVVRVRSKPASSLYSQPNHPMSILGRSPTPNRTATPHLIPHPRLLLFQLMERRRTTGVSVSGSDKCAHTVGEDRLRRPDS